MYEIARKIVPQHVKGVEVVQLKGGISHSSVNTYANETIALFADAFQTRQEIYLFQLYLIMQ